MNYKFKSEKFKKVISNDFFSSETINKFAKNSY